MKRHTEMKPWKTAALSGGANTLRKETEISEYKDMTLAKFRQVLVDETVASAFAAGKDTGPKEPARQSNRQVVEALDASLLTVNGWGVSVFETLPVQHLPADSKRVFVKTVCPNSGIIRRRFMIETKDGHQKVEVDIDLDKDSRLQRPTIHLTADSCGPVGTGLKRCLPHGTELPSIMFDFTV